MKPEQMFLNTIEQLQILINSYHEYEIIRASHLIRQLLLDGQKSLVERVNKSHRLKIKYRVVKTSPPDIPGLPPLKAWCAVDSIVPYMAPPGSQPVSMNWEKFQKQIVAIIDGHRYSVHDIVDYVAHIAGGVHLGSPNTDRARILASLDRQIPSTNLNIIVMTLRGIGRIILTGLSDLKDRVLMTERFEDGPGLSIYSAIALARMPGGRENYVFDIGVEESRNRVTVFLDAHGELCLRIFFASGRMETLRAGSFGGTYRFGEPIYLACEIGLQTDAVLVKIDSSFWSVSRAFSGADALNFGDKIYLVVGSDIHGRAQANMWMMELAILDKVQSNEERRNARDHLTRKLADGYSRATEYEPGAFVHTVGHPNFPANDATGNNLVSSGGRGPKLRILR